MACVDFREMRIPAETIQFVDLEAQLSQIGSEVMKEIQDSVYSADYILGEKVEKFEKEFAGFVGAKFCTGVASGTDALFLSLKSLGVGEGATVILPVNTFIATALAVSQTGAVPIFVDVDERTFNISTEQLDDLIREDTKAIIPVHLYGQAAQMERILDISEKYDLKVVEDACQAHGAIYHPWGKKAGSMGDCGCFSFYPSKNLGCLGDGGAVTTSDERLFMKLKMLRNYGQEKKHHHLIKGFNSRLDTLQAAILKVKLRHIDEWNSKRAENAFFYNSLLKHVEEVVTPQFQPDLEFCHVFHLYVIRTKRRDDLLEFLNKKGIKCGIHYPVPLHLQDAFKELGYEKGDFPVAEKLSGEILSLPMYPELGRREIKCVVDSIKEFCKKD